MKNWATNLGARQQNNRMTKCLLINGHDVTPDINFKVLNEGKKYFYKRKSETMLQIKGY